MTAKKIAPDSGESDSSRSATATDAVPEPGVADRAADNPVRAEPGSDVSGDNETAGQMLENEDPIKTAIERIPNDAAKTKLPMLLEPILRKLAECDAPTAEAYLSYCIGPRFGLSAADLKAYRRLIEKYRGEAARANRSESDTTPRKFLWKDERVISPAQDFLGATAYYCVYRTEVTGPEGGPSQTVRVPCLVTSRRKIFPLSVEELAARGLRLARDDLRSSDMRRWSVDPDVPNSVPAFLEGKAQTDPLALFDDIETLFRRYIHLSDDRCYLLLTIWSIGTYVFMLFQSYPYLNLEATSRAGKTRTMEVAAPVCFNSLMTASITSSALYRAVEADRSTIFIDEGDDFASRTSKNADLLKILNAGYKASGAVTRTDPRSGSAVSSPAYCPKMIANIDGFNPTLRDRGIPLPLVRAKEDGEAKDEFRTRDLESELAALRNGLHVFALTHHKAIGEIYKKQALPAKWFANREREMWSPIIALANFFDLERRKSSPDLAEEDHLTVKMARLALDCGRLKADRQADDTVELQVLRGVVAFVEWVRNGGSPSPALGDSRYRSDSLLDFVKRQEEIPGLKKNRLTRALQNLQLLRGPEDKAYGRQKDGVRVLIYRLDPDRIREARERYGV